MDQVPGYRLDRFEYEIEGYLVHSAIGLDDQRRYLAKTPGDEFPSIEKVQRLDHELRTVAESGDPTGALRPVCRVEQNRTSYLLLEHFAGKPLVQQCARGLPVDEALELGRAICRALDACHARGLIHLRLSPNTVLWDRASGDVRLTHFAHASREVGTGEATAQAHMLGFCSAPEQTGRIAFGIDHRTDLYSFGGLLFFILTGTYPFAAADRFELVHSLLAAQAPLPSKHRPDLPPGLDEIVRRLLAKDPSERHPSALQVELELAAVREYRKPPDSPRRTSSSPPLLPMSRPPLLGRSEELRRLLGFVEASRNGASQIVRLSGSAGTGKTRLLTEVQGAIADNNHVVLFGKFEQFQTCAPYSGLLSALMMFLDRLLAAPQPVLDHWRERFARIDRELSAVLVAQIPRLGAVIGDIETHSSLEVTEEANRFHNAFHALTDVLCDKDHPLVLMLDDFQWADDASLDLVRRLFVADRRPYLMLLIGERTDHSVPAGTAARLLSELTDSGEVEHIVLTDLSSESIANLCAAVLGPCLRAELLAEAVHARSGGNPLLALEILKAMQRSGSLRWLLHENSDRIWEYSDEKASAVSPSEDVVTLVAKRVERLPSQDLQVLKFVSACSGPVQRSVLSTLTGLSDDGLDKAIRALQAEGLLIVEADQGAPTRVGRTRVAGIRFSHDRLQQAVRSLCNSSELDKLHHDIGRALWDEAQDAPTDEQAFAIAEHLNPVSSQLNDADRQRLALLNLTAARAAKAAVAYVSALGLFRSVLAIAATVNEPFLEESAFDVERELGECNYLCSNFDEADRIFDMLLAKTTDPSRRATLFRTQMVLYLHLQRYREAIGVGRRALGALRDRITERPSALRLVLKVGSIALLTRRLNADDILAREVTSTARDQQILNLLILLWTPSFWVNQPLNGLVGLRLLELGLRVGPVAELAMGLVCYAVFQHMVLRRYERALALGRFAARVVARAPNPFVRSRVDFILLTFFGPFERSNRKNVDEYEKAVAQCIQFGEHVFAGCCIDGISTSIPISGFKIPDILARLDACESLARRIGSTGSSALILLVRRWASALGQVSTPTSDENAPILEHEAYSGFADLLAMSTAYLMADDEQVFRLSRRISRNQIVQSNPLHAAWFELVRLLAGCRQLSLSRRGPRAPGTFPRGARSLKAGLRRLERFSTMNRENFHSSVLLARAEIARLGGDAEGALEGYRACLTEASALEHYWIHGVAAERLAGFYDARAQDGLYRDYVRVAAYSYRRWGAFAKEAQLMAAHPNVDFRDGSETAELSRPATLDADAIMRASYAIAEETRSDRLAEKLLTVLTTSAGGQRGFLIKELHGEQWIVAGWDAETRERTWKPELVTNTEVLSEQVVRFVGRTRELLHLTDPGASTTFEGDPYLKRTRPRSILCVPLMTRGSLVGIVYLENGLASGVFHERQRKLASLLGHQAAIALSTADHHKLQLDALQSKVNPHFLYNALNAIAELVVSAPEKAERALLLLADLYRYLLSVTADDGVGLDEELRIAKAYLSLEQLRHGTKLRYDLHIQGDPARVRVPALIVQPLLENAVKHGISQRTDGGRIDVTVDITSSDCTICVKDNGLGWGLGPAGAGVGLRNIRERLSLAYGDRHTFRIDTTNGVTITMSLPTNTLRA